MKQTITAGASVLLLCSAAALAEVTCDDDGNENPAVPASTPTAQFELHADGTVTDTTTELVWMRCALGQAWDGTTCTGTANTHAWQEALQEVQNLNGNGGFAGHTDWRLPNVRELGSIVEQRCWEPAINAAVFLNAPTGWFWSSSPHAYNTGNAWVVNFDGGRVNWGGEYVDPRVRLVRAGQ